MSTVGHPHGNLLWMELSMAEPMAPRSAALAAWMRSWRAGFVSYDEVLDEIRGYDADHLVDGLPSAGSPVSLADGLATFSRLGPDDIWLVLPSPGDPRGLPGPGPFTDAALSAGEGVLCGATGLVPEVETRLSGSGDVWRTVIWRTPPLTGSAPLTGGGPDPLTLARRGAPTVAEADHDLLMALREATDVLRELDVARWRPELAAALTDLRRESDDRGLPPGYDARCGRLVGRAGTVSRILALAAADAPGGAVSAFEAAERDAALRPLATAARRAHAAAVNAPLR
jgi:hypothetical protein